MISPTNGLIVSSAPRAPKPLPNPADGALKFLSTLARLPADRLHPWGLHKGRGPGGAAPPTALPCLSYRPSPQGHLQHPQHGVDPPAHRLHVRHRITNTAQLELSHPGLLLQSFLFLRAQHTGSWLQEEPGSLCRRAHRRVYTTRTYPTSHGLKKQHTSFLSPPQPQKQTNIRK